MCGRIKKYNRWIEVDREVKREVEGYEGTVAIIPVKCPVCRVRVKK